MYTNTQEKSEKIREMYLEGVKLTQICEETKTSQSTVKKILASFGIDYDVREKQKYQEKLDLALELYEQGKSQCYIEKELNLTRKTIRELIKNKEVHYKSKSEQWRLRYGHTLKEDAFETITPESAYWIGFLYTDGHITGDKTEGYNVELLIQRGDREHLQKYLDFLECSNRIEDGVSNGNDYSRVRIGCRRLHESLKNLGFTNQKSYDAVPHESVQNSKDFWRGCIDGDGGIYNPYQNQLSKHIFFCGTFDSVIGFICFCESNTNIKNRKFPTKHDTIFQVSYYGKEAEEIADLLYKNATVYLDRKYQIYLNWLQNN
jgi:hypothetical protein